MEYLRVERTSAHAGPDRHHCLKVSLCWASQLPVFAGIHPRVNPAPLGRCQVRKDCWVSDPMPRSLLGQDGVQYNPTKTSSWPVFVLQGLWLLRMLRLSVLYFLWHLAPSTGVSRRYILWVWYQSSCCDSWRSEQCPVQELGAVCLLQGETNSSLNAC